MRVLVTGGSGFVGSVVAERLHRDGHSVAVLDIKKPTTDVDWLSHDLLDGADLPRLLQGFDAVLHLAAVGDVYEAMRNPLLASRTNADGTLNLTLAAIKGGVRQFVYASTWEVYGPPTYQPIDERHPCAPEHPYSITKLAGEQLCRFYGRTTEMRVTCLRLGTAFGPGMRPTTVFARFIARGLAGEPLRVSGTGHQFRQFTHVNDIADAFSKVIEYDGAHQVLNVLTDEVTTILALAEAIAAKFAVGIEREEPRVGDPPSAVVSSRLAANELHWEAKASLEHELDAIIDDQRHRSPTGSPSGVHPPGPGRAETPGH